MENETLNRDRIIVRTSIIGILTNVLLAGFKAAVGLLSNSIAVILDAVNNLSDALSSVITIVGTKLAGRLPDKKHPLGYGRIEYLSSELFNKRPTTRVTFYSTTGGLKKLSDTNIME